MKENERKERKEMTTNEETGGKETMKKTMTAEEKEKWYYSEFGIALRKVTPIYNEGERRKMSVYVFLAEDNYGNRHAYTWYLNDDMGLTAAPVVYARAWAEENGIKAVKVAACKTETGATSEARELKYDFLSGEINLKESDTNKGFYEISVSSSEEKSSEESSSGTGFPKTANENSGTGFPKTANGNSGTGFPKTTCEAVSKECGNTQKKQLTKEEIRLMREYDDVKRRFEKLIEKTNKGEYTGEMRMAVDEQREAMHKYMAALRLRARLMGFNVVNGAKLPYCDEKPDFI